MAKCEKCKNYIKEAQGCLYMDADCVNDSMFEPFTNYDRIRNMSIDEMAEIISKNEHCEMVCAFTKDGKCNSIGTGSSACVEGCKKWLESEVE